MRRTRLNALQCPVARSLDRVGEWWSILILRDAMAGVTRFDDFQKSLGIASNILSRRLSKLVDSGLLERRRYCERPERFEYVLTECGRDFRPVLWAILAWGNRHFAPEGPSLVLVDAATGDWAEPILADLKSGKRLDTPAFRPAAGPAAGPLLRSRYRAVSPRSGAPLETLADDFT